MPLDILSITHTTPQPGASNDLTDGSRKAHAPVCSYRNSDLKETVSPQTLTCLVSNPFAPPVSAFRGHTHMEAQKWNALGLWWEEHFPAPQPLCPSPPSLCPTPRGLHQNDHLGTQRHTVCRSLYLIPGLRQVRTFLPKAAAR